MGKTGVPASQAVERTRCAGAGTRVRGTGALLSG